MATDKVQVLGGFSRPRQVSVVSDRFVATAFAEYDGKITTRVVPVQRSFERIRQNMPLLTGRMLFSPIMRHSKGRLQEKIPDTIKNHVLVPLVKQMAGEDANVEEAVKFADTLFQVGRNAQMVAQTRPWHGAEHMIICSYLVTGSASLDDARKFSPVQGKCGGRYILPLVLWGALGYAASVRIEHRTAQIGVLWLMAELMLQADKHWGFHTLPVFAQATTLLQQYATTSQPGELELQTAHAALHALLDAHAAQED